MQRHSLALVTIIRIASIVAGLAFCVGANAVQRSMVERYSDFREVEASIFPLPEMERARKIRESYRSLFPEASGHGAITGVAKDDLLLMFKAANSAAFFTADREFVAHMVQIVSAMEEAGVAGSAVYGELHAAMIHVRMFRQAKNLEASRPSRRYEQIPDFQGETEASGASEWVVDGDKRELVRREIGMDRGVLIVVAAHPACHFSGDAVRRIMNSAVLAPIFRDFAKWLVPPSRSLSIDAVQKWNKDNLAVQMSLANRREDWPEIDSWETPTFYFFKDGRRVAKVEGWPAEGRVEEISNALRQVGLLP